jgi:hypothetical protein
VWAIGCVVYELAALVPPFEASNQVTLALKIKEGRFPPLPPCYSSELQRVVTSMLQVEVRSSPTGVVRGLTPHGSKRCGRRSKISSSTRRSRRRSPSASSSSSAPRSGGTRCKFVLTHVL